jgi:hypothetical protein
VGGFEVLRSTHLTGLSVGVDQTTDHILPIGPPAKDLFKEWDHARQLAPRLMVVRESKQEPDLDVLDKLPHTLDELAGGPSAFRQLLFEVIPDRQVLAVADRDR